MAELPKNTRREFLAGRAALDAAGALAVQAADAVAPQNRQGGGESCAVPPAPVEEFLVHYRRQAMACQFEWIVPAGRYEQEAEAAMAALDEVDALEAQLTVYRPTSELMAINRRAATEAVSVEPRLFALLQTALRLSAETDGAYDITSGPLSQAWGFYRRQGRMPAAAEIDEILDRVGSHHVSLDPGSLSIRFDRPGVELNLGSIGKGYALDRAAEVLRAAGIDRALLHGGRSSVLAIVPEPPANERRLPPNEPITLRSPSTIDAAIESDVGATGWIVGIGDPARPGKRLARVQLANRAMGTSGSSEQFFRYGGKRYGHILDPRTGWPAEGLLSATVLAPTAAEADAYATACYVLGLDGALRLCEQAGLSGIFVEQRAGGGRPIIHRCGLADGEFWLEDASDQSA